MSVQSFSKRMDPDHAGYKKSGGEAARFHSLGRSGQGSFVTEAAFVRPGPGLEVASPEIALAEDLAR
jgi:hypothetical protein